MGLLGAKISPSDSGLSLGLWARHPRHRSLMNPQVNLTDVNFHSTEDLVSTLIIHHFYISAQVAELLWVMYHAQEFLYLSEQWMEITLLGYFQDLWFLSFDKRENLF